MFPPKVTILVATLANIASGLCLKTGSDIEGPFRWGNAQTASNVPQTPYPLRSDLLVSEYAKQCPVPEQLLFQGAVTDVNCSALSEFRVEIWGASRQAAYSPNSEASYRGAAITDAQGRFSFNTVFPAPYPNGGQLRPSHIHMEVVDPLGAKVLTTQYYFENDPYIPSDPWASRAGSNRILRLNNSLAGQLFVHASVVVSPPMDSNGLARDSSDGLPATSAKYLLLLTLMFFERNI